MQFNVLGSFQVVGPDGTHIKLASAEQRRLACFLVLRANRMVPSQVLEEHLRLTPGALRTSISRLRRFLGSDTILNESPGYHLQADTVDALEFDRLLAVARSSDEETAHRALDEALALWRGDAYGEFADEVWATAEATRLTEL